MTIRTKISIIIGSVMGLSATTQANMSSTVASISALEEKSAYQISDMIMLSELQKRVMTESAVQQAYYALLSEISDTDNDSVSEAATMRATISGYSPPIGGGFVPADSLGPKTDGYSMPLGYCSWDNGADNTSVDRISGDNPVSNGSISFAVISAGNDRSFNNSCADMLSGAVSGDDVHVLATVGMGNLGVATNQYIGRPVADLAALYSLDTSLTKPGEIRVVLNVGTVYGWLDPESDGTYAWTPMSSKSYFHYGDSNGGSPGGEYTSTPFGVGIGAKFSVTSVAPQAELEVDGQARFVKGSGAVDTSGNAQVHVGSAEAAPGTAGEVARLAIQPFGHTGGPFNFFARDGASTAFLDVRYGGTTFSESLMTMSVTGTDRRVGIASPAPASTFSVGGGDDATLGPNLTLHGIASNQFESGRIRFTETPGSLAGSFIHYDGSTASGGTFNLGVHHTDDMNRTNDINVLSIARDTQHVGFNTNSPEHTLHIRSAGGPDADTVVVIESDPDNSGGEENNPRLVLRQDGGLAEGVFGKTSDPDIDYLGSAVNATYLESTGGDPLQLVTGRDILTPGSKGSARMTVLSNGNIGIGTSNPQEKLSVTDGNFRVYGDSQYVDMGVYRKPAVVTPDDNGDGYEHAVMGVMTNTGKAFVGGSHGLQFFPDSDTSIDSSKSMSLTHDGDLGLGTNNPLAKLDVNGSIRAESGMQIGDNPVVDINGRNIKISAENLAPGWYTVAKNVGDRAIARFALRDTSSSRHQSTVFYASTLFGTHSTINVLSHGVYGEDKTPVPLIRILTGGDADVYAGALLQVYVEQSINRLEFMMLGDNFQDRAWEIANWVPDGTDPGGLNTFANINHRSAEVKLKMLPKGGFATTEGIYLTNAKGFGGSNPSDNANTAGAIVFGGNTSENFQIFKQSTGGGSTYCGPSSDHDCYMFMMTDTNADNPDGSIMFGGTGQDDVFEPYFYVNGEGRSYFKASENHNVSTNSNVLNVLSKYGRGSMGPLNTSYFHFGTTMPGFYFYKPVTAVGGFNTASDIRLKKNLKPLDNALESVRKLNGFSYGWRSEAYPERGLSKSRRDIGVIAQELEPIFPELVTTDQEGIKSVNYDGLIPVLIEATKELDQKNQEQDAVLEQHETELELLKADIRRHELRLKKLDEGTPGTVEPSDASADEPVADLTEAANDIEYAQKHTSGLGRFYGQ